jgi:hypothetical protein
MNGFSSTADFCFMIPCISLYIDDFFPEFSREEYRKYEEEEKKVRVEGGEKSEMVPLIAETLECSCSID